ncbi:MAG: transferrin receptor-like dimerization domain-containing protein, partial [Pyrinomonadaceae bacterium]
KAVVYINSDSNGRGFLGVGGSHTLEKFVNEVTKDVTDPETKIPVWERMKDRQLVNGSNEAKREARERSDLRIGALGSGSDYTPFIQHLGIAAIDLGYGGEDGGGSYHSIYDSFDHYTRFGDPNFEYGVALSKTAGRMVLRMADADVLPFEFTDFADTVGNYVKEVMTLADTMREDTTRMNRMISDGSLKATQDPTETFIVPQSKPNVPYLNFAPLENALAKLQESAKNYQAAMKNKKQLSPATESQLNDILTNAEQTLLSSKGLPRREWFKHQIYAPGFYTGYGVKTLPGVREAIEQRNWMEAAQQMEIVSKIIENFAAEIDKATALAK